MKYYFLFTIILASFIMSGCDKKNIKLDVEIPSSSMQSKTGDSSHIAVPLSQLSLSGKLGSFISITGTNGVIVISGHSLNYNSLFYINIPKNLNSRSHERISSEFSGNEQLSFGEETYSKFFYISLTDTHLQRVSLTEREYCLSSTDYNGTEFSFKETTTQQINNRNIFITSLTITTEGNINPYTHITHFCFVNDDSVYNLVLDNYSFSQANQILNSLHFY